MHSTSIGEPIPRGLVAVHSDHVSSPQESNASNKRDAWKELTVIGLNLAFLPALMWGRFVTTNTMAWQSWVFPNSERRAAGAVPSDFQTASIDPLME